MSDSTYLSVTDLARGIGNGSKNPVDAVETCLERIRSLDGQLGAFQVVYEDEAMVGAEGAARACTSGHRIGPFHGVPFALKDIVDVEGRITTGGCRRSRARSAVVATKATAPSLSWQQSRSRKTGSAIQRDSWWSSTVMGFW